MDALAAIGVLAGDERLTFVHPLVEASVHAALPAGERAEAHLWVARALADDDAPAEVVAAHLLHAGKGGGEWVTRTLQTAAARALATGAADRAVELLERARQEPPPSVAARARAARAGQGPGDRRSTRGARPAGRGDRAPAGRRRAGRDGARDRAHAALARAPRGGHRGLRPGRAVRRRTATASWARLLRAASATAARLQHGRVARPGGGRRQRPAHADTPTGRALLAQLALDAALRGDPHEQVRELATRALARGALLDDEGAEGIVYYLATAALTVAEDLQMAEAALAAAVDDARSRGSALGLATASHFQSFAIMRRGRVTAAAAAARAALAGERHGWRLALPSAHVVLAAALAEAGDLDGADAQVELAGLHGEHRRRIAARPPRRPRRAAPGPPAPAGGAGRLPGLRRAARGRRGAEPVGAPLALGRGPGAGGAGRPGRGPRAWRTRSWRWRAAFGAPGAIGRALRTIGALEVGKRAVEPLEAAVACLEDSQTALERARALVDLGCTLRRAHRSRDAREPLRRGLDLAQRCGAGQLAARAMREVTAAGARPAAHRPARSRGPDSARAADRRARGRGEVQPGDRGRAVRDREDGRMAPQAQLRQARDLLAARAGGGARTPPPARRSRRPEPRPRTFGCAPEGQEFDRRMRDRTEAPQGLVRCGRYTPRSRGDARRTVQ